MPKDVWMNVTSSMEIRTGLENIPNKKGLISSFEKSINDSGLIFEKWIQNKKAPYECIISNGDIEYDILLYLKSISNAGWEDKPHIKRVQVSNSNLMSLNSQRIESKTKLNLIIGFYNYETPLFAGWDASEYTRHKTNRSCYIDTNDLIDGYNKKFIKKTSSSREVTIFTPENIKRYIEEISEKNDKLPEVELSLEGLKEVGSWVATSIIDYNKTLNNHWDGKECILEMKDGNSKNWKQMEWIGFYLEHLVENVLGKQLDLFSVGHGSTKFDLFKDIPWDLKAHSLNSSSSKSIITNDFDAIEYAIEEFGYVGFIILEGDSEYDENQEFKLWHDELKGKKSKYVEKNEAENKNSRRRKKGFDIKGIKIVLMDKEELENQSSFQKGMKNSNGKERKAKVLLKIDKIIKKENIIALN